MTKASSETTSTKPVCDVCNDTHRLTKHHANGDERKVLCSWCPRPCNACMSGGGHPYCRKTPCDCECHKTLLQKRSEVPGALSDIYEALKLKEGDQNVHAAVIEIKRLQKEAKTVRGTREILLKATAFDFGDGRSINSWWNYPAQARRYMGVLPGPDNIATFGDLPGALYFVMGREIDGD